MFKAFYLSEWNLLRSSEQICIRICHIIYSSLEIFKCFAFIKKIFPIIKIPTEMNIAIPEYLSLNTVVLTRITTIINTRDRYKPLIYFKLENLLLLHDQVCTFT